MQYWKTTHPFGFLDSMTIVEDCLEIKGWMLWQDGPADWIEFSNDHGEAEHAEFVLREDVASVLHKVPGAERGGYRGILPLKHIEWNGLYSFMINGYRGDKLIGSRRIYYHLQDSKYPMPPPELMARATGNRFADYFYAKGVQNCHELLAGVIKHKPLNSIRRSLEWGCGCGRISRHLQHRLGATKTYGADKDVECVSWLQKKAPYGTFVLCKETPPLDFPDHHFDLIVAATVAPIVPRTLHGEWIRELNRVLSPKGVLVLTTHGYHAAITMFQDDLLKRMDRDGFFDGLADDRFVKTDPSGDYQRIFQSSEHTRKTWGQEFVEVDMIEAGMNCFDDIWIFTK